MEKLKNLFSYSGRIKRKTFLRTIFYSGLLTWVAALADEHLVAPNLCLLNEDWICYLPGEVRDGITLHEIVGVLLIVFVLIPAMVKRLHDHEKSGWWVLIGLTGVGLLPLLFWFLTKGKKVVDAESV